MTIRVCVIGAGAAGLAAARRLTNRKDAFDFVVYEQNAAIGGQWNYNEKIESKSNFHSSMYKNLRTNIPKEVMSFPDFPFPVSGPSFLHHSEVQDYLLKFCSNYGLMKYIKLNTEISEVRPMKINKTEAVTWSVTSRNKLTDDINTENFDSVMVCNGRYSKPNIPDIQGLKDFTGKVIHSHEYDDPSSFAGKRVVCLGRGPSGIDISIEISSFAEKVYISHNKESLKSPLPTNTFQISGIESIDGNSVKFKDDKVEDVDAIILCTGYHYSYPFLHQDIPLEIKDNRVTPLYKHLINIELPSLAIWAIPFVVSPFPFFDTQVLFFLNVLEGKLKLPSKENMYLDEKKDFAQRLESGLSTRFAHLMGPRQWTYQDDLFQLANFDGTNVPKVVRELYNYVHDVRVQDVMNYKDLNFRVENGEFNLRQ